MQEKKYRTFFSIVAIVTASANRSHPNPMLCYISSDYPLASHRFLFSSTQLGKYDMSERCFCYLPGTAFVHFACARGE